MFWISGGLSEHWISKGDSQATRTMIVEDITPSLWPIRLGVYVRGFSVVSHQCGDADISPTIPRRKTHKHWKIEARRYSIHVLLYGKQQHKITATTCKLWTNEYLTVVCSLVYLSPWLILTRVVIAMSFLTFLFDTLVYLVTLKHTYEWRKLIGEHVKHGVLSQMHKDGERMFQRQIIK